MKNKHIELNDNKICNYNPDKLLTNYINNLRSDINWDNIIVYMNNRNYNYFKQRRVESRLIEVLFYIDNFFDKNCHVEYLICSYFKIKIGIDNKLKDNQFEFYERL